jgi:hypothetical protein
MKANYRNISQAFGKPADEYRVETEVETVPETT